MQNLRNTCHEDHNNDANRETNRERRLQVADTPEAPSPPARTRANGKTPAKKGLDTRHLNSQGNEKSKNFFFFFF